MFSFIKSLSKNDIKIVSMIIVFAMFYFSAQMGIGFFVGYFFGGLYAVKRIASRKR